MDLDVVSMALNVMMSDYDDNGNISQTAQQFPTGLLFEALQRGKSNVSNVKPNHKNLLLRTIDAIEMNLHINETVIRCKIVGLDEDIMKEMV